MSWKPCSILMLIVLASASGCGPSGPVMAPVSGTVALDGEPMTDGFIYFKKPEDGAMDRMEIKNGNFEGRVEIGDRRVEVSQFREGKPFKMGEAELPNKINTIDASYNSNSTMTANVTEDGPNEFAFEVKSKGSEPQL